MENKMREVAKILRVGFKEEFNIQFNDNQLYAGGPFTISDDGLEDRKGLILNSLLIELLLGTSTIKPLPYKPKFETVYFYVDSNGNVKCTIWENTELDRNNISLENCFMTPFEAEQAKEKSYENKYLKALNEIKNEYDAIYFENKYGENTHSEQFKLLEELKDKGQFVPQALAWIKNEYDCFYMNKIIEVKDNPFYYLEQLINCMESEDGISE